MANRSSTPRRAHAPWLESLDESEASRPASRKRLRGFEAVIAVAVVTLVVAFAIWFLFFASGGPGPGTV
jgi:hypothetical protein